MSLFQQSVLKKYLTDIDKSQLENAWQLFREHFFNPVIQQNIRDSKEEEYQEGFVRDLFVNVLGYTLNPQPQYNFVLEKKTVTDATKSDGAILLNGEVTAVVELKDTGTPDLDKVSNQAFGYKHKHKNCVYVITSNFEKLRFYINDSTDYEEFELFTLTQQRFAILYLCLQKQNLLSNIPLQVKQASLVQEENVTKKLYADYSLFKRKLFQNIIEQNTQYDKLMLFKKTQKLLDRFLFILFAEDRLLVPPNSVREILQQWEDLKSKYDAYFPLYDRFKKYFGYLNLGHKGKQHEIFAYNGGLFFPDEILDNIIIDDSILYDGTKTLSSYDFETDVDVNILGHIFEHSLAEIEELQSELEGKAVEKNKTKRKKEGVYYTPRYITKYIVENTVGALCLQKKEELQINEETFAPQKRKANRKALLATIETYRNWLLQLTICDPACGSGAFLNAALEYLIAEHRTADELKARIFGDAIVYTDIENSILENNLYGVDINEDAIEIARLSLWLRTAKKGRKLSNLSNNIKCGNSLIDDASVAGDKAFKWKEEFKNVFENGRFDVVIGNPPYVFGGNEGITTSEKTYFKKKFVTGSGKINLFTLFIEKAFNILKINGQFSFIIPNTFLRVTSYNESRKFFLNNFSFREIADLGADVFNDAVTTAIILVASKKAPSPNNVIRVLKDFSGNYTNINLSDLVANDFVITTNISDNGNSLMKKLILDSSLLGNECKEMIFGVVITKNKEEVVSEIQHEGYKPFLEGRDITSYFVKPVRQYLNYKPGLLHRARTKEVFEVPEKLLVQRITGGQTPLKVAYDNQQLYNKESINNIILNEDSKFKLKFILSLLNSSLINWYYNNQFTNESTLTVNISKEYLSRIPIKKISESEQQPFIDKADIMLSKNKELNQLLQQFTQLLQSKFATININNKLQNWANLTSNEFFKELVKQKIKLPLSEQQQWLQYFEEQKTKANNIQQVIQQTDREIDKMAYELYGLSEEEVKIVEEASDVLK